MYLIEDKHIGFGARKFNANPEIQSAYLEVVQKPNKDLVYAIATTKEAMKAVSAKKMYLLGPGGKA